MVGFAERDKRDERVIAVDRGARGRVRQAGDVFLGGFGGSIFL